MTTTATARPLVVTEALMVRSTTAAAMIGVSPRHWRRLDSAGRLPESVRLGKCKLYRVRDLVLWCERGCPDRQQLERLMAPIEWAAEAS